jgi:hypothetical protein
VQVFAGSVLNITGQAVEVIGFPMGRDVEVGRRVTGETVPQASVSRGELPSRWVLTRPRSSCATTSTKDGCRSEPPFPQ